MKQEQKREKLGKVRRNGKRVWKRAGQNSRVNNTEQHRHVFVLPKSLQQHLRCFWMGFLFKFGHHSFLPLSLLFIFRCGTFFNFFSSDKSFWLRVYPFFSEGKLVGKHGAARGNVTFGRATHPLKCISSRMDFLLLQWNIRLCHTKSRAWLLSTCVSWCFVYRPSWQGCLCWFFSPFLFLALCLSSNKGHIVAVFISTPNGVCLRLDSKPGTARLLPFWSPFL